MKRLAMVTGILLCASTALAGQRLSYGVAVASTYGYGAMGSARNSADSTQYLQVQTTQTSAVVYARDAGGKSAMCITTNPALVESARSVKSDSYIYFSWDGTGACTAIDIHTASWAEPKNP